jgi:hypothetical protein
LINLTSKPWKMSKRLNKRHLQLLRQLRLRAEVTQLWTWKQSIQRNQGPAEMLEMKMIASEIFKKL